MFIPAYKMTEKLPKRLPGSSPPANVNKHVAKRLKVDVEGFGTLEYAFELAPDTSKDTEQSPTHSHPPPQTPPHTFLPPSHELSDPEDQERAALLDASHAPSHAPTNLTATAASLRADGSPEPSGDTRIPLWQNETRAFKGEFAYPRKSRGLATRLAREAQRAELMVDGKPQFNLFVDGSYKQNHDNRGAPEHRRFGRGGYGVVFRNPYHGKGLAECDHNHDDEAQYCTKVPQDSLSTKDFNIRSWRSHRVLSSLHAELAAISQGMETVISLHKRHHPLSASVTIFTDSKTAMNRLSRRLRSDAADGEAIITETEPITTTDALTMPLVRAIVWQSHFLSERGCEIKLQWLKRCTVLAHKLADDVAGWWRKEHAVFYQRDRPLWRRDGILDALHHEALVKVIERIEAEALLRPPLVSASQRRKQAKRERQERERERERESRSQDMLLENFSGSAMQTRMNSDPLLKMPPIWERNAAFSMVNVDMAKILKGSPFENEYLYRGACMVFF